MKRNLLIIVAVLGLCACTKKDNPVTSSPDMSGVRANLAFTCVHQADHLPPLDPKADGLFRYARYLEKNEGSKISMILLGIIGSQQHMDTIRRIRIYSHSFLKG